jgi:hypothetical protein
MASNAEALTSEIGPATVASDRPYAPSWVNLLIDWLERLPGPRWLGYVLGSLAGVGLSVGALALEPAAGTTAQTTSLALVYYACLPFAALALISSLDRSAARALQALRPLLTYDDRQLADAHRRLTVAPARPTAIIGVVSLALTGLSLAADPAGSGIVGFSALGVFFRWAWESFITAIFLVLVYHTFRQLGHIDRIHDSVGRIDGFDQTPLYAMSGVTSGTAAGLILLLVPSLFLLPSDAGVTYYLITAVWYGFALLVGVSAFFLPLRGMHARLSSEKERLQGEVGRRISTTLEGMHAAVDAGDTDQLEIRNKALASLVAERDLVNRVPTWPWSTASLTRFVSAVLLPLGLWFATRLLERVF